MQVSTRMRQAFLSLKVQPSSPAALVNSVAKAAENGAGVKQVNDWNASLSLRTYQALKRIGVMH